MIVPLQVLHEREVLVRLVVNREPEEPTVLIVVRCIDHREELELICAGLNSAEAEGVVVDRTSEVEWGERKLVLDVDLLDAGVDSACTIVIDLVVAIRARRAHHGCPRRVQRHDNLGCLVPERHICLIGHGIHISLVERRSVTKG